MATLGPKVATNHKLNAPILSEKFFHLEPMIDSFKQNYDLKLVGETDQEIENRN
jgi:hypothetical protein